jgi:hypothetical protein
MLGETIDDVSDKRKLSTASRRHAQRGASRAYLYNQYFLLSS